MSKIIPFSNDDEESCCAYCDLVNEYIEVIKYMESKEELFNALRELVSEAGDITLHDYLVQEIGSKIHLLEHIDGECHCHEDNDLQ